MSMMFSAHEEPLTRSRSCPITLEIPTIGGGDKHGASSELWAVTMVIDQVVLSRSWCIWFRRHRHGRCRYTEVVLPPKCVSENVMVIRILTIYYISFRDV